MSNNPAVNAASISSNSSDLCYLSELDEDCNSFTKLTKVVNLVKVSLANSNQQSAVSS
jgi:hypothetical protein